MRTLVRGCAALSVIVLLAATALAQGTDVTGKWVFDVQTGQGGGNPIVTFKQDGEKLTGHYSSATLGEADFTGTIKGNAIRFTFEANAQGAAVDVVYDGTVDKDTMKGTVAIAAGQVGGTFTARKQ